MAKNSKGAASKAGKVPAKGKSTEKLKASAKDKQKPKAKEVAKVKVVKPASKPQVKPAKPVKKAAPPVKVKAPLKKVDVKPAPTKGKKAKEEPKKSVDLKAKKELDLKAKKKDEAKPAIKVEAPKAKDKKEDKSTASKKDLKKKAKKEVEEDDILAGDDDGFGDSELDEYSEDIEELEELDEASDDIDELYEASIKDRADEEVVLTDAEGRRYCRVRECDQVAIVDAYCRYHYLLFWKKIQVRKKILADGKLERYVEELTSRYPDKFLEMIRRDLRTEKDFLVAIQELEIDDSGSDTDYEEDAQSYIEEVRGMSEGGGSVDEEEF
jgi:hypothetical protein